MARWRMWVLPLLRQARGKEGCRVRLSRRLDRRLLGLRRLGDERSSMGD